MAAHPADNLLSDYGLGKLAGAANETVEAHLTACDDCRQRVAALSADGFVERLRRAAPPEAGSGYEASRAPVEKSTVFSADDANIPPVLLTLQTYADIRRLGQGGMGEIFLARNVRMDREEVLKVMSKSMMERAGAASRFEREIRSVGKLNHPNIVTTYAAQQVGDTVILSMENAGEDLAKHVDRRGPLPVPRACYFIHQAALGLQYAHEKNLVHRDIKPSNLMALQTGSKWQVKVLDFGLAKSRTEAPDASDTDHQTKTGQALGTPSYMAPEQIRDAKNVDIRADIYALGCTLYFLLTGRPPFVEDNIMSLIFAHGEKVPQPTNELRPDVPGALAELIAKMLAKDPKDRPQTPAEVAKALVPFIKPGAKPSETVTTASQAETDVASRTQPFVAVQRPPRKRWPAVALGLALLALGAVAVGSLFIKTERGTIVLDDLPADAVVTIDGGVATVSRNGDKATIAIDRDGTYAVVVRSGTEVMAKDVTVKIGGEPVRVRYEKPDAPKPAAAEVAVQPPAAAPNFVSLFNGKQVTGLRTFPNYKGTWAIENDLLVLRGIRNPRVHPAPANAGVLESTRTYRDFVLRIEHAPLEPTDRSMPIIVRLTSSRLPFVGYHITGGGLSKSGSWTSPGEILRVASKADEDDDRDPAQASQGFRPMQPFWNKPYTIEIAAVGNRITTSVDGVKVHEVTDPSPNGGPIRLQAMKATRVRYRKIEIQDLSAPNAPAPAPEVLLPTDPPEPEEDRKAKLRGVGIWTIKDDVLTGRASSSSLYFGDPKWTDYEFEVDYRVISGPPEVSVSARLAYSADSQYAMVKLGTESNTLDLWTGGDLKPLESARKPIRHSDWNKVRLRVADNRFQCFVGPVDKPQTTPVFSRTVRMPQAGQVFIGIGYPRQPRAAVVEFKNIVVKSLDGKVLWEGLPELPAP
jgi:serine/threonine protein kinase